LLVFLLVSGSKRSWRIWKVEKVKRGRIVAVRDPKTIEVLELRVGYAKDRFGKLQAGHQASGRAAFMRLHAPSSRSFGES
jgi:hypothetical protein